MISAFDDNGNSLGLSYGEELLIEIDMKDLMDETYIATNSCILNQRAIQYHAFAANQTYSVIQIEITPEKDSQQDDWVLFLKAATPPMPEIFDYRLTLQKAELSAFTVLLNQSYISPGVIYYMGITDQKTKCNATVPIMVYVTRFREISCIGSHDGIGDWIEGDPICEVMNDRCI